MKNKYKLWKQCFILLTSFVGIVGLMGCTKLSCDFSTSPSEPHAGEIVTFTNHSTGADDYEWDFGDNGTSTVSSPTHIYYKPGTYTVTLQIIRNKVEKRSQTHQVVILDTIPTIATDTDSIYTFTPLRISACAFNPWEKEMTYKWTLPQQAVVLEGLNLDSNIVVCYFTEPMPTTHIGLALNIGEHNYSLERTDTIYHQAAPSVIYQNDGQVYEHYIYFVRQQRLLQSAQVATNSSRQLLNSEQDTLWTYGKKVFTRDTVSKILGQSVIGFQGDRLMAKLYAYNANGLYVCNIDGLHLRQLVASPIQAIKVDGAGNRLYWATADGLYNHRLMQMSDNLEPFSPEKINSCTQITRISINSDKH